MYEQWHPLGVVGRDLRVQFPGGRVVLERIPGGDQRQCHGVEALAEDRAVLARRAAHLQSGARASRAAADLPDLHRRRHRSGAALRRRSARGAGVLHRLDARRPADRRDASPSGSARACSSSAATTPSSSTTAPISTWRCPAIVFGAVGTAGQRCTTTRRVLVHRSRAAELERRLVAAYAPGAHRRSAGRATP